MNSKLKIAIMLLCLFAGLLVFFTIEHYGRLARAMIPIAAFGLFAYLIYCAVTLLRNSSTLDTATGTDESCGNGCGCQTNRPTASKAAKKVTK